MIQGVLEFLLGRNLSSFHLLLMYSSLLYAVQTASTWRAQCVVGLYQAPQAAAATVFHADTLAQSLTI